MSARPDEAVIRLRESNRRICCFRGGTKVRVASGNYVAVDEPLFHAGVQVSLFPGFASCLINVCWIFVGFSFSIFLFFFFFLFFVFDPC